MSVDDGLILKRHPDENPVYSLWYQEGRNKARKLVEGNGIQQMLRAAEEKQEGVEFGIRLVGWVEHAQ